MKKRFTLRCAVFLILTKYENGKKYILCQKRQNTGILDNQYDIACSGHLEKDESVKEAMIREAKEEIGIDINYEDLEYSSTIHATFYDSDYILVTFKTDKYSGTPTIMEPDKCSELKWFEIDNLPEELATTRQVMLYNDKNNIKYSEYGFEK